MVIACSFCKKVGSTGLVPRVEVELEQRNRERDAYTRRCVCCFGGIGTRLKGLLCSMGGLVPSEGKRYKGIGTVVVVMKV